MNWVSGRAWAAAPELTCRIDLRGEGLRGDMGEVGERGVRMGGVGSMSGGVGLSKPLLADTGLSIGFGDGCKG